LPVFPSSFIVERSTYSFALRLKRLIVIVNRILLVVAVVVIAACIFVPRLMKNSYARLQYVSVRQAAQLGYEVQHYAVDHHGQYPPSLDALFPIYLNDRTILASPFKPDDPEGYLYTPPGPKDADLHNTVIVEDKYSPTLYHRRIMGYADGRGQIVGTQ
jgi:type II secretory pathway pseudopilin PulG